ncbi:hypothetical protein [Pseudomonas sp. PE-S1G-1]|uniref:hypothetical protein n=1 Tax=Pseudomonas sp. PE-S1G-1 TaxID=1986995 RepID=UPI000B3FAC95|nr:hypothetical protein [Pseudomonas sp. PE-S1G-1]
MLLSVKRIDKLVGYADVPITVIVELYSEGRDLDETIEKNILNNEIASFDFECYEFDVICLVDGWTLRDWMGLRGTQPLNLPCGLKKSHSTYLENYKAVADNKAESKREQESDGRHIVTQQADASQVVDRSKKAVGLTIMFLAMIAIFTGIFILSVHGLGSYSHLGWLFSAIGVIGLIASALTIEGSGANDTRCQKCQSNRITFLNEGEEYKGTYSKQESVLNKNTGYTEFARVIKTDFWVTEYYKCDLCSHTWTKSYIRSTTSN